MLELNIEFLFQINLYFCSYYDTQSSETKVAMILVAELMSSEQLILMHPIDVLRLPKKHVLISSCIYCVLLGLGYTSYMIDITWLNRFFLKLSFYFFFYFIESFDIKKCLSNQYYEYLLSTGQVRIKL